LKRLIRGGVVFVLLPGGYLRVPRPPQLQAIANGISESEAADGKYIRVRIDPFFLSKYELTQSQWLTVMGSNPSHYGAGHPSLQPRYPVDSISAFEALEFCEKLGYGLPTEMQLHYATRAKTNTIWWSGDTESSIRAVENL